MNFGVFNDILSGAWYPYAFLAIASLMIPRKHVKSKEALFFLDFAIVILVLYKIVMAFFGKTISDRYFYLLGALIVVNAVLFIQWFYSYGKIFIKSPAYRHLFISAFVLVLCCSSLGKSLHFRDAKPYLKELALVIKNNYPAGDIAILSDVKVKRIAYFIEARQFYTQKLTSEYIHNVLSHQANINKTVLVISKIPPAEIKQLSIWFKGMKVIHKTEKTNIYLYEIPKKLPDSR